jgi:hypothetical protein
VRIRTLSCGSRIRKLPYLWINLGGTGWKPILTQAKACGYLLLSRSAGAQNPLIFLSLPRLTPAAS